VENALTNNINPIIEIRRSGSNSATPLRFTRSTGEHFNIGITKYNGFAISGMNSNIGLASDVFTVSDSGRVGILTRSPHVDLHIKQSITAISGVRGGLRLEATNTSDYWQIHHSAVHCSFTENGTRRAYVEGGTGEWTISSDRALKKNIEPLGSILERVLRLKAVNFHYADSDETRPKSQGFIAQEVAEVFPEIVKTDEAGGKGLAYANFAVLAIKAIQEQQEVIDQLRSEIDQLKARLK
jgi:hypothetical protein